MSLPPLLVPLRGARLLLPLRCLLTLVDNECAAAAAIARPEGRSWERKASFPIALSRVCGKLLVKHPYEPVWTAVVGLLGGVGPHSASTTGIDVEECKQKCQHFLQKDDTCVNNKGKTCVTVMAQCTERLNNPSCNGKAHP